MNECARCGKTLQGGDLVIPVEQVYSWSGSYVLTSNPSPRIFVHVWCPTDGVAR